MDFVQIQQKEGRGKKDEAMKAVDLLPDFRVGPSREIMVRGGHFLAIWDEESGLWSRDDLDVQRLVDAKIQKKADELSADGFVVSPKFLASYNTQGWTKFRRFCKDMGDNAKDLDSKIVFANTETKKTDYATRKLPYAMLPGPIPAFMEMISTLYDPDEMAKIVWAIGSVISGDSKKIQKFLVFHGPGGTGKGTVFDILEMLFPGYISRINLKNLTSQNNQFATEGLKSNPLIAIDPDGDLSRIEDNTKLNSIVSHEKILVNEKFKSQYEAHFHALVMLGTNDPVKITNAKSGLIRRLIDVYPSGRLLPLDRYMALFEQLEFELGAIADYCLTEYRKMGRGFYQHYRPTRMMQQTDYFYNFILAHEELFAEQDYTFTQQAFALYKEYVKETEQQYPLNQMKFKDELRNYFEKYLDREYVDGVRVRGYFSGFKNRPNIPQPSEAGRYSISLDSEVSLLDELLKDMPAQYANNDGNPRLYWDDKERVIRGDYRKPTPDEICSTTLADIDTSKLHFVKVPEGHIVVDFDLTDESGEKSLALNLEAAAKFPATYTEVSKSGKGIHLHYNYLGDTSQLAPIYGDGIEVKVYRGNASLRRQVSKCNTHPVETISSGLPLKEERTMIAGEVTIDTEQKLRSLIRNVMQRDIKTIEKITFIYGDLRRAQAQGVVYDVSDMKNQIVTLALASHNQSDRALDMVRGMPFSSETSVPDNVTHGTAMVSQPRPQREAVHIPKRTEDAPLVFFDIEIFSNHILICWMYDGPGDEVSVMWDPSPAAVAQLLQYNLAGFNCKGYDNHMIWARIMGYSTELLYKLSKAIISGDRNAGFSSAANVSYIDVYEMLSVPKSLKKLQLELNIHHVELDIPWDEPLPDEKKEIVEEYCKNDVRSLRDVFHHNKADYQARLILADLSGLRVNDRTNRHSAEIIFEGDRYPQSEFIYTDLSEMFPGYTFDRYAKGKKEKSKYRGVNVGEGGFVYAEPGVYENVALLDIESMHPASIVALNMYGDRYTKRFKDLMDARLAIKHLMIAIEEYLEDRSDMNNARIFTYLKEAEYSLDGQMKPYLMGVSWAKDETDAQIKEVVRGLKTLSDSLKIVINSVYGMSSASFPNAFKDERNIDNIVAKRGALFMVDLLMALQERGVQVIHIKTDSIKIPNASNETIQFVKEFGEKYGYKFVHEATYKKMALINDAVYIAQYPNGEWTATGARYKHPYVFKELFTHQPIETRDMYEIKEAMGGAKFYLDFDASQKPMHSYEGMMYIGKTGRFVPVTQETGGGVLYRVDKTGKKTAPAGTKDFLWMEAELFEARMQGGTDVDIDTRYFEILKDDAVKEIEKFMPFDEFMEL